MNKMQIKIVVLSSFLFLTACGDQKIIEHVGFINLMGLDLIDEQDYEENRNLLVTASIPQVDKAAQRKREVISTVAISDKKAMLQLSRKTNRIVVSGKIKVILFGMNLAKHGIKENIDTFGRDPVFGRKVNVVVVEGIANELMQQDFPEKPRPSMYLDELLGKEAKLNTIPSSNLFQFHRDFKDKGRDPSAPLIKLEKDEAIIDGIALFRDDKYITKLEPHLSRYFFFLNGDFSAGAINMKFKEEGKKEPVQLMYSSLKNTRDVSVSYKDDQNINVKMLITVEGSPLEYNGNKNLENPEDQKYLEKKIEDHIKETCEMVVKKLQDNKVDSLGLGRYVRNKITYEHWQEMDWLNDVYPNIKVDVEVKANIKNFGIRK